MVHGRDLSTCRLFTGYLTGYRTCTTQVELDASHERLWIHLASVSRFSVALVRGAVDELATTLASNSVCAVACRHDRHGQVLLGVQPQTESGVVPYAERGFDARYESPMRLYLYLDETEPNRIAITFTAVVTSALVAHLRACRSDMSE